MVLTCATREEEEGARPITLLEPHFLDRALENQWNYGDSVSKVNNHSKMAWWRPYFTEEIIISFFDLTKNPKGELNTIKIRNRLPSILGLNSVTLSIAQLW